MRAPIYFACAALLTCSLVEAGSCALARTGALRIELPRYTLPAAQSSLPAHFRGYWADIDPHFGVWHAPHATYHHVRECFDVLYRTNAHGMRDVERAKDGPERRVVVLGDSLIEGWGVARGQRLTDLLERSTGVPHLNFGTAGNFGPTQYYLLYKHLAKSFAHDTVLVGLLPFNDFTDDDLAFGRRVFPDRYRPYWQGEHPNYRLVYHRERLDAQVTPLAPPRLTVEALLRDFTHTYNAFVFAKRVALSEQPRDYSGYYDFTEAELLRMQHSLRLLREEAGDRRVVLAMLPVLGDFARFRAGGPPPLTARLTEFGKAHGIEVVDLLPGFAATKPEPDDRILPCDGHWSARGHETAHELLLGALWKHARN